MKLELILNLAIRRAESDKRLVERGELYNGLVKGRTDLIILKMLIRGVISQYLARHDEIRDLERQQAKLQKQGITVVFLEHWIAKKKNELKLSNASLVECGHAVFNALDFWKQSGATLKDLCNLCNRNYEQVCKRIAEHTEDSEDFSKLMFAYNLDYPPYDKSDFINFEVDAPFTHAVKEYMLDIMLNTAEGQKASDEALQTVFPELWGNAAIRQVDEDGNEFFTDREGNEIDFEDGR